MGGCECHVIRGGTITNTFPHPFELQTNSSHKKEQRAYSHTIVVRSCRSHFVSFKFFICFSMETESTVK